MARYTIEICTPRNGGAVFAPLGRSARLRGRWDFGRTAHRTVGDEGAGAVYKQLSLVVQVIPGHLISVDTETKKGQILDPLGETPAGRAIFAKISDVFERMSATSFTGENALETGLKPHPTKTHDLNIDQIKTWLFHMRTMVDTELAVRVDGASPLPEIDAIRKMPGRRFRDPACTLEMLAKNADHAIESRELYQWADEVPADAQMVGAGANGGSEGKGGKGGKPPE